ncbi:MAG: ATP synthase F1 subunit epsilon [Planctomycetota bacterium]
MSGSLNLRVITPERIQLDTTCSSIQFITVDGYVGVLKDHAPMVAALGVGGLAFGDEGSDDKEAMFVAGGFAEVRDNTVRIVTEASERPTDIDVDRASKAADRARQRLEQGTVDGSAVDFLRAQASLRRAMMRMQIANRYQ